jgi:hypothetical protein
MSHGGKREGAGRKPGMVSKAKQDLVEMAKGYAGDALMVLVNVMSNDAEPASARISAATALLDRGYGKPTQAIAHGQDPDNPMPAAITLSIVRPSEQP